MLADAGEHPGKRERPCPDVRFIDFVYICPTAREFRIRRSVHAIQIMAGPSGKTFPQSTNHSLA